MRKFTPNDPTEITRGISEKFPTLYLENGVGGGDRQMEVSFRKVNDEWEVEFEISTRPRMGMMGISDDYNYMYLRQEDIPQLIEFLQEVVDGE